MESNGGINEEYAPEIAGVQKKVARLTQRRMLTVHTHEKCVADQEDNRSMSRDFGFRGSPIDILFCRSDFLAIQPPRIFLWPCLPL